MQTSQHTQSVKNLLGYALPYAFGYSLLPYFLNELGLMLDSFLLTILVVIVLNILIIVIFHQRQQRGLEKIECSRIALLSMGFTLLISITAFYFNIMEVPWLKTGDKSIYRIIGVAGLVAFVINYAVVFYSLWLLQRFWQKL